jgi:syntaxin-binding protein 1
MSSVNQIIQDSRKQLYQSIHLYFISSLSDLLFEKIKAARINIKTLKELQIDFICPDPNYFSLETPDSFMNLYNPQVNSLLQYELQKTAKKICSVLVQMGEYPYIRCHSKPQLFTTNRQKTMTFELAQMIEKELELIRKQDPQYPPPSKYPRAILLLLDRKIDVHSILVHDIHYQAMLADLGNLHQRKIVDGDNKEHLLDETDLFWPQVRNWHISQVMDFVSEKFEQFKKDNMAAQYELGSKHVDVQQLKDVVTSFGDYQQTKEVVARHVSICSHVSKLFASRGLEPIVDLEQQIATQGYCKQKEMERILVDPTIEYCFINQTT